MKSLHFKNRVLCFDSTKVMGILNVTPDSFSDGGKYLSQADAVNHALDMIDSGADIIDIGGESTRPGSDPVGIEDELKRVVPVIQQLKKESPDSIISIDTTKYQVAEAAIFAGADIINDISGLQVSPEITVLAARENAGLILMHMRGTPATMQKPEHLVYSNVLNDIIDFLVKKVGFAIQKGVRRESIALDPGIGFSKNLEQNLEIIRNIRKFKEIGYPILVGPSRKSFIGAVLNEPDPEKRLWGTAGTISWLAMQKVEIVRVHDVKEMKQVLRLVETVSEQKEV